MSLRVYYQRFVVGELLSEPGQGARFRYAPDWLATRGAFPVSTAIPLTDRIYEAERVEPWFANLLPEEANLRAVLRALGAAEGDLQTILQAIGGDTAGALSFGVPNDPADHRYLPLVDYYRERRGQTFAGVAEAFAFHINELGARPFMIDDDGVRTSLAGGQEKTVLATLENGRPVLGVGVDCRDRLAVPMAGAPSTVIVKPDNPHLPGIVENEAYCLELARRIGLPAVEWAIIAGAEGRSALAVARYDRRESTRGLTRVHQEDLAQALGVPPRQKYEHATGGGPSLLDILSVGQRLSLARDRLTLLDYVIYNILVANTDAHAKNYSLLIESGGEVRLAPLYDVTCVLPWADVPVNQYHAQNLGGRKRRPHDMQKRYWEDLAVAAGFNPRETVRRVRDLADAMVGQQMAAKQAVAAWPHVNAAALDTVADAVDKTVRRVGGRL